MQNQFNNMGIFLVHLMIVINTFFLHSYMFLVVTFSDNDNLSSFQSSSDQLHPVDSYLIIREETDAIIGKEVSSLRVICNLLCYSNFICM
jgi:hypothetical protein